MDKDTRIKGERRGEWKEAKGRGMIEGPSHLSPRNRHEDQRPYSQSPAHLAAVGPLASSFVHLNEQILDILDLPLHGLSPLPQLSVPCL